MKVKAQTVSAYIAALPPSQQEQVEALRQQVLAHTPTGFVEQKNYNMIGYVVPHERYPGGYHCQPDLPLPFISIGAQKNFVALYHMGIYADQSLLAWFEKAYAETGQKLDMGKSCIRFKYSVQIPLELIGELCQKITVQEWIAIYESELKPKSKN